MGVGRLSQEALPTRTTLPPQGQSLSNLSPNTLRTHCAPAPPSVWPWGWGRGDPPSIRAAPGTSEADVEGYWPEDMARLGPYQPSPPLPPPAHSHPDAPDPWSKSLLLRGAEDQ